MRTVQAHEAWTFTAGAAEHALREHFGVLTLDGFGLTGHPVAAGAAGAVMHYLTEHLRRDLSQITGIGYYETKQFLHVDAASLRNLEVLEPLHRDTPGARSLLTAWQRTVTPMGARLLRDWLSQPLSVRDEVVRRQDAVAAWVSEAEALEGFRVSLREVRDLERTLGRLVAGSGSGRDLVSLKLGLEQVPSLVRRVRALAGRGLQGFEVRDGVREEVSLLESLAAMLSPEPELVEAVGRAVVDEPPALVKEGGVIRDGYSAELDELRSARRNGQEWIARLQQEEVERTGIPSLKIRFNSVFGYFIEVTKSNLDRVPPEYIRKQTVAGGERFITPALKEMEGKILGAEERAMKLEYALFQEVREQVLARTQSIQATASGIA